MLNLQGSVSGRTSDVPAYSRSRIVIWRLSQKQPIHDEAAPAVVGNPGILRADPSLEVRYDSDTRRYA
jgi:hypothetical protein